MKKVLEIQAEQEFHGGRKDVDKEVRDMTEEEKAVFDCMEDEKNVFDNQYEELDDDFLLALNENKPAMEQVKNVHKLPPTQKELDAIEEAKNEDLGAFENMIPNYKERMADVIGMLDQQKEMRKVLAET